MSQSRNKGGKPGHPLPGTRPNAVAGHNGFAQKVFATAGSWFQAKHSVLKFVLLFALLLGLAYSLTLTPLFKKHLFPSYLQLNAQAAHGILKAFGQPTTVQGRSIAGAGFALDINRGCDAVEPTFLLLAALLAFPASWKRKIPGLVVGTLFLAVLNLARIVSLFYIGKYWPRFFDAMHIEVWQMAFILLALVFWGLWIQWAFRPSAKPVLCPPPGPLPSS